MILAELSNNSFEWKKCDILGGQNILWTILHIFQGGRDPHSQDIRPGVES